MITKFLLQYKLKQQLSHYTHLHVKLNYQNLKTEQEKLQNINIKDHTFIYRFTFILTKSIDITYIPILPIGEISFLSHVLVGFPNIKWSADKRLTNGYLGKKNILICNICQFMWHIFYHYGQVQSTNITYCTSGGRCTQASSRKPAPARPVAPLLRLPFKYYFISLLY